VSINWNDKDLKIKWPIKKPIISKKDKNAISFLKFKSEFLK
jgi:dTDP-4-dehydrorhamnose 3,5-epimerase